MTETPGASRGSGTPLARSPGSASPRVQERLEREARGRRALFVASIAGLAATLGIVAGSAGESPATAPAQQAVIQNAADQRVIAEIPVPGAGNAQVETIVRIMAPAQNAPAPHIRTRAS